MLVSESRRNVGGLERAARLALGVVLVHRALKRTGGTNAGFLTGALGADLLGTGITGYCPMNAALGRDSYHA